MGSVNLLLSFFALAKIIRFVNKGICWARYCSDVGMSASARNKSAPPELLAGWHNWADTMPDLKNTAMCSWTWGAHTGGKQYDRAVVNGHKFASKRIRKQAKASNSIIMIRPEGSLPQIGEVRGFYEFVPPWAMREPHGAVLSIADLQ